MDGPNWIDRLPDEMLALVLSHLPARDLLLAARAVCRRWRDLVPDRRVWWRCSLRIASMEDVPLAMSTLLLAPCLHRLLLDLGNGFTPTLSNYYVGEILVSAASVSISCLELRGIDWPIAKRAIQAQAKHLHSVDVSVRGGSLSTLDMLQTVCKLKLTQLTLNTVSGVRSVKPYGRAAMAPWGAPGCSAKRSLKRLDLACLNMPDALVESLVRASAHSLEEVMIVNAYCPRAVAALAECASRLRHLDLYCKMAVPAILHKCEKLTSLCLRCVSAHQGDQMQEFFRNATALKSLTFQIADARATFKCLGSLAASGRSSLLHLRLFSHDSSSILPSVEGEEPLCGAELVCLRTLRLNDCAPQAFLLRWQSPPALQILDLGGSECRVFGECLLESIRLALDSSLSLQLHVIRFKFILCESEAAHARLTCCHQHCGSGYNSAGWTRLSPTCGLFSHLPSVGCHICSNKYHRVAEWLWSGDNKFNFDGMWSKSTVYH